MRSRTAQLVPLFCLLVLALAGAAVAQPTIYRGTDQFRTLAGNGTRISFAANPIPAGFFCANSPPFTGDVDLAGRPLTTSPPGVLGDADTVVERLTDGVFSGGVATIDLVVRAIGLRGVDAITVECPGEGPTRWFVEACLCGKQPKTTIQARLECDQCGSFSGQLALNICLNFTRADTGAKAGPLPQHIAFDVEKTPWCYRPGPGDNVVRMAYGVDDNCDCENDATLCLGPNSNFFPGRGCATDGLDCWTQFASLTHCHKNFTNPDQHPHCVNPVCGRKGT
ncbi:MAG: hypothetical protein U0002_20445 [Thermoanaerobaculia bacterium]